MAITVIIKYFNSGCLLCYVFRSNYKLKISESGVYKCEFKNTYGQDTEFKSVSVIGMYRSYFMYSLYYVYCVVYNKVYCIMYSVYTV